MTIPNKQIVEKSSQIVGIGYDPEAHILYIEFKRGSWYSYADVPENIYEEFRAAPSVGKYFFANIKGKYDYARVT